MSWLAIKGTLLRKLLVLTIMGQRVFPQSIFEPLQITQRLSWRARVVIWLGCAGLALLFRSSFSQFSEDVPVGVVVGLRMLHG